MLEKPDYLKIGKAMPVCTACGKSLVETDRLASVLVAAEGEILPDQQPEDIAPATEPEVAPAEAVAPTPPAKKGEAAESEEENPFARRDYCTKCWQGLKDAAYFSFWIGHRAVSGIPAQKLNKTERNIALAALFDSLAERDQEETDFSPHLFFLAHLLMKFKVFKWLPSGPNPETGETMLRFVKVQTGEEVYIRDMDMADEMIVKIKEEVETYLTETTGQPVRI